MIKLTTVLHAADTTSSLADLLILLSNSEDQQIHALLEPFNELIWKQDGAPSCAILVRNEMEDGSFNYNIGMSFKGVDYMIHDYDLTPNRSVEKLKTWFPHINPQYYRELKLKEANANLGLERGAEYFIDLFGEGIKPLPPIPDRRKRK
jgi:hypothetical protein